MYVCARAHVCARVFTCVIVLLLLLLLLLKERAQHIGGTVAKRARALHLVVKSGVRLLASPRQHKPLLLLLHNSPDGLALNRSVVHTAPHDKQGGT